ILGRSWAIFQREMGMCLAIVLLYLFMSFLGNLPMQVIGVMVDARVIPPALAPQALVAQIALYAMSLAWGYYLSLGASIALLKIVRGQPAQIGDLFAGGAFFW